VPIRSEEEDAQRQILQMKNRLGEQCIAGGLGDWFSDRRNIQRQEGYNWAMSSNSPEEARRYLAGLALANEFEIEELRGASIELKLRQLWALMTADLVENGMQREAEARTVRERWARLYRALNA
jgi:hypothetical protein